jgi:hypothetical protein
VSSCSDSSSDTGTSYKIESLAGLFVIFAIISILSLLLFAWLKRFIIKDYLCKLAHEKHLLAQQNISDERLPKENFNEPSQTYQIGLDSPLVVHF